MTPSELAEARAAQARVVLAAADSLFDDLRSTGGGLNEGQPGRHHVGGHTVAVGM